MPRYDYQCKDCGHTEERICSIDSDPKIMFTCIICGGESRRIISAANFILHGKDWPGQEIKRAREDDKLYSAANRARKLKQSGIIPHEEHLTGQNVPDISID